MVGMTKNWLAGAFLMLSATLVGATGLSSAVVTEQESDQERIFDGVIEAVHQSTMSAQMLGRVVEINYDVDDFVPKGAVIIRFRDAEPRARLDQAKAGLLEAEARFTEARDELARVEDLYAKKLLSRAGLDKAQAGKKAAAARVEAAQARFDEAKEQLAYTEVRAPFAGIVTERHVELGETVSVGQPLMSGFSYEHLRATVHIPQAFVVAVREQAIANIMLSDDRRVVAESVQVFPYADPETHAFQVRVALPEGDHGVYPGMFVKVAFVVGEAKRLLLPVAAVVHRSELTGVYVLDEGRVKLRQIRVGRRSGEYLEVLAGLESGERIALDPIAAGIELKQQQQ